MPDDYKLAIEDETTSKAVATRASSINKAERRNRILALRRQGFTYEETAEIISEGKDGKLPVKTHRDSCTRVVNNWIRELAAEDKESVEVMRTIDNDRLDVMFRRLEVSARSDDPKEQVEAVRAQLRIMERRAKLNGLDQPTRHQVEGAIDHRLIADADHVRDIDASFARRHGGKPLALPLPDD